MATGASKAWGIGILVTLLIIVIIYAIVMFETFKNQSFIFTPYIPPTPPSNHFYPLGDVRPLTQEEIDQRNRVICLSAGAADSPQCQGVT